MKAPTITLLGPKRLWIIIVNIIIIIIIVVVVVVVAVVIITVVIPFFVWLPVLFFEVSTANISPSARTPILRIPHALSPARNL